MSNEQLTYISVNNLIHYHFIVPTYQRGYRWSRNQVEKLFDDIYEEKGERYYLQPLVISKVNGFEEKWNVIDGQQRLTTIFIMIGALDYLISKHSNNIINSSNSPLTLEYESRDSSKRFLSFLTDSKNLTYLSIESLSQNGIWEAFIRNNFGENLERNLDFEYMLDAYCISIEKLKKIIKSDAYNELAEFKQRLLNNCKFVWYQIRVNEGNDTRKSEIEQFSKINMGKIELTDAELIKAEMMNPSRLNPQLNRKTVKEKQHAISEMWYLIDNELRKPDFWAFVPHEGQYMLENHRTRIDVLFEFLLLEHELENGKEINNYIKELELPCEYSLFLRVVRLLDYDKTTDKAVDKTWSKIRDIFEKLKELYESDGRNQIEDAKSKKKVENSAFIYNLLSFITFYRQQKEKNNRFVYLKNYEIFYELLNEDRDKRIIYIKEQINKTVFGHGKIADKIKKMRYGAAQGDELREILLLYNLILLSKSTGIGSRYNFLEHNRRQWTREHIFPQNMGVSSIRNQKELLRNQKELLELLSSNLDGEDNIKLQKEIMLRYVNYLHGREEYYRLPNGDLSKEYSSPPFGLRNSGIINWDQDKEEIESFLHKEVKDEYEQEYANKLRLIQKSIELLSKINILEFNEKLIDYQEDNIEEIIKHIKSNNAIFKDITVELLVTIFEADIENSNRELKMVLENKQLFPDFNAEYINKIINGYSFMRNSNSSEVRQEESLPIEYEDMNEFTETFKTIYEIIIDNIENSSLDISILKRILETTNRSITAKVSSFFSKDFTELMSDNSIGNMALLDSIVNGSHSIGNKSFSKKKVEIFEKMKSGEFIPLATILTFTDVHTEKRISDEYWMYESRYAYLHNIIDTITNYLRLKKDGKDKSNVSGK